MVNLQKRTVRLILFLLNVMFILFGSSLIAVGVYITIDHGTVSEIVGSSIYNVGSYVLIFGGAIIILLAFCGYFGADKENRCLIIMYIVILILMLILLLISGILVLAFGSSMTVAAKSAMNYSLVNQYGRHVLVTDAWNLMQSKIRCCGIEDRGWSVYKNSWWDLFENADIYDRNIKITESSPFYKFVPVSCCWTLVDPLTGWPTDIKRNIEQCQHWEFGPPTRDSGPQNDAIFYRGCFGAATDYLMMHAKGIGAVAIVLFIILILAIICSIILLKKIRSD